MIKQLYEHHYIEEQCRYKGVEYTILLNKAGWRTAYLNVTGSVLQYVNYNNIDLDVHGGLTYSEDHLPFEKETPKNREFWYIGWDYAHYGDGIDLASVKKYFGEVEYNPLISANNFMPYTRVDVRHDCFEAIDKLHTTGGILI